MKHLYIIITLVFLTFVQVNAHVEKTNYRNWSDCYRISNKQCEVIIGTSCGGRVLSFSIAGKNIIYESETQNGKLLNDWQKERFDPDAGRFDFGPERTTQPIHAQTWMGSWKAEIIDSQTLRLISIADTLLGLKCTREFKLHPDSAILTISQSAINIAGKPMVRHFWGRTLVKPGGTLFIPINSKSRFEQGWGQFLWDPDRIVSPAFPDRRVKIQSQTFCFLAIGKTLKGGNDATEGWMAYVMDEFAFIKRFQVYADQDYSGSEHMTGIFYSNSIFCELEPCSPTYIIKPGDSIAFSELWELKKILSARLSNDAVIQLIRNK